MVLAQKYQPFLTNRLETGAPSPMLDLTAAGWKLLVKENLTPLIETKLAMRQIGDAIWADNYRDGKRRVLSFFKLNDAYATFQWGWNFDFVPRWASGKTLWARTDKTIYPHIYELSPDFYAGDYVHDSIRRRAREQTIISRCGVRLSDLEKALADKIRQHQKVFNHLLPLMLTYYQATAAYEGILQRISHNMQEAYYRFIGGSDNAISYVFIEKRLGWTEKAWRDFETIPFATEKSKRMPNG